MTFLIATHATNAGKLISGGVADPDYHRWAALPQKVMVT
jgi:hypothetical protein